MRDCVCESRLGGPLLARGLSLFGGASSEVRRCSCSVVGVAQQPSCSLCVFLPNRLYVCLPVFAPDFRPRSFVRSSPNITNYHLPTRGARAFRTLPHCPSCLSRPSCPSAHSRRHPTCATPCATGRLRRDVQAAQPAGLEHHRSPPCADSSPYLSWTRLWDGWCSRPGCRRQVELLQDGILQQVSPTAPFRRAGPRFPPEWLSPRCFFHRWTGLRRS